VAGFPIENDSKYGGVVTKLPDFPEVHISDGEESLLNPACSRCGEIMIRPQKDEIYLHAFLLEVPQIGKFETKWPDWAKL
jgi:hypothetical protein